MNQWPGYNTRPLANGGARVRHLQSGEAAECKDHPVFTMNVDAAIAEIQARL